MTKRTQHDVAPRFENVAVLGGGVFGTAFATVCARAGCRTKLWARRTKIAERHLLYMQGGLCNISITECLNSAIEPSDVVVLAVPAAAIRTICKQIFPYLRPLTPIFSCAKGIELRTTLLMSEVIMEELPNRSVGVLSGPTFAKDLHLGEPAALIAASTMIPIDRNGWYLANQFAQSVSGGLFRVLVSDDMIGVEIGGAMKNVSALACGLCRAAGYSESTLAAIATQGLNDAARLASAAGGRPETLMTLSGFGDTLLSCTSEHSRNFSFGARWLKRSDTLTIEDKVVVEGIHTVSAALALGARYNCPLPTSAFVHSVIVEGKSIRVVLENYWTGLS